MEKTRIVDVNNIKNPVKRVVLKTAQAICKAFGWVLFLAIGEETFGESKNARHCRSFMLYFEKPEKRLQS